MFGKTGTTGNQKVGGVTSMENQKTCQGTCQNICTPDCPGDHETDMNRRDFGKKATAVGVLSALSLFTAPQAALAWMDGNVLERRDLGAAFKALIRTYSDTTPYPHKFNDALVKSQLRDLDFAVRKGVDKEFAHHYVLTLGTLINKYIKKGVVKFGKDTFLWGIFERTSCSYQLYERIDIKEGVRTVPCPFKPILDHIHKSMGTYKITWDDVHNKWCIPVWTGFADSCGVKLKVEPGETCTVKVI